MLLEISHDLAEKSVRTIPTLPSGRSTLRGRKGVGCRHIKFTAQECETTKRWGYSADEELSGKCNLYRKNDVKVSKQKKTKKWEHQFSGLPGTVPSGRQAWGQLEDIKSWVSSTITIMSLSKQACSLYKWLKWQRDSPGHQNIMKLIKVSCLNSRLKKKLSYFKRTITLTSKKELSVSTFKVQLNQFIHMIIQ